MHCPTRRSLSRLAPVAALLGLALAGCSGPNHPEQVVNTTAQSLTNTAQGHLRSGDGLVQYRVQGTLDVEVDSIGGDVTVIGDPDASATTVEVVREAHHGYLRGTDSFEALGMVDWSSSLLPGPGPLETLKILTTYDGPEVWFMRTHVRIVTPDLGSVTVHTPRGSIEIINNTGAVDVHTDEGGILVASMHPQRGRNTLIGNEGDIDYRVPRGSTGDFDLGVIDGDIQMRVTEGQWRYTDRSNTKDLVTATLNAGTNPVMIRTTEGDIRISVVRNPLGFGPIRTGA
jgi:hypothetical protein